MPGKAQKRSPKRAVRSTLTASIPAAPRECRRVPKEFDPVGKRIAAAKALRSDRAKAMATLPPPGGAPSAGLCNGDETLAGYIANFTKGLRHTCNGQVVPEAYDQFLKALKEPRVCSFDETIETALGTIRCPGRLGPRRRVQLNFSLTASSDWCQQDDHGKPLGQRGYRLLLDNPLAPLALTLEGADAHVLQIFKFTSPPKGKSSRPTLIPVPPPPKFIDKAEIAEMAELYWMALLRDVPFQCYGQTGKSSSADNANVAAANLVDAAVQDLNTNFGYYFQKAPNGGTGAAVNANTLFRGFTAGDRVGPYVSQFFVRPVPVGRLTINPRQKTAAMRYDYGGEPNSESDCQGRDYLTAFDEWLQRQRGYVPQQPGLNTIDPCFDIESRLIRAPRDAAEYVHVDVVFQEYFNACFILFTPPSLRSSFPRDAVYDDVDHDRRALPYAGGLFDAQRTLDPNLPYQHSDVQKGFITLGNHDVKTMIGEVARRALVAAWYQKWSIHRRLRPEEFGGRIEAVRRKAADHYPWNDGEYQKLERGVLQRIFRENAANHPSNDAEGGTYLLPQAFPEGCPIHPAYTAGHATVAGACVTVLKALFNDDLPLNQLRYVDSQGNEHRSFYPVQPSADGRQLEPYEGDDADQMTLGGELDKLASNVSLFRNLAGVHWRSDHTYSLLLGQAVAILYLCDMVNTYSEESAQVVNNGKPSPCDQRPDLSFTLRTFEGHRIRIAKGATLSPLDAISVVGPPPAGAPDLREIYTPGYD